MTVGAWLRERSPRPPERLTERVEAVLGDRCNLEGSGTTDYCLEAAERLLREVLTRPSVGRDAALDLLTVDALVTYAFEAASETPSSLESRATDAMARLAGAARE